MGKIFLIGGGELRGKTTLPIDAYIRSFINKEKPYALFVPTASHDSKPYFNSFRKTYTTERGCKSEVALITTGEMTMEKIAEKTRLADIIYVGGGNTEYMLNVWKESGFDRILMEAYDRGAVIAGLSAGAIFWFEYFLSSTLKDADSAKPYAVRKGMGILPGIITPHLQNAEIEEAFIKECRNNSYSSYIGIENDCALVYDDFELTEAVSCGGKAFFYTFGENVSKKEEIKALNLNN